MQDPASRFQAPSSPLLVRGTLRRTKTVSTVSKESRPGLTWWLSGSRTTQTALRVWRFGRVRLRWSTFAWSGRRILGRDKLNDGAQLNFFRLPATCFGLGHRHGMRGAPKCEYHAQS